MGTKIEAPAPVNYGQQMADTLLAQVEMEKGTGRFKGLGRRVDLEREFGPQYAQIQLDQLKQVTPEILSLYQNSIAPGLTETENTSRMISRKGDIQSIEQLGPRARAAMRLANPEQAALVDTMTTNAQAALNAGGQLTPEQMRDVQQSSRAAFADRGLGASPSGALDEIIRGRLASYGMEQQRQAQAMQALAAGQAFYGDPFQQILGRPSQAFQASGGFLGQAQGMDPGMIFNPESNLSAQIMNMNYQGELGARTASASNRAGLFGAGIGALGRIGSSLKIPGLFG